MLSCVLPTFYYTNIILYCIVRYAHNDTDALSVVVGAHNLNEDEDSQRRHDIEQVILHEDYRYPQHNDIALLRVRGSIQFNEFVKPICVDASVFPSGTLCYVTGWGTTEPDIDKSQYCNLVLSHLVVVVILY